MSYSLIILDIIFLGNLMGKQTFYYRYVLVLQNCHFFQQFVVGNSSACVTALNSTVLGVVLLNIQCLHDYETLCSNSNTGFELIEKTKDITWWDDLSLNYSLVF